MTAHLLGGFVILFIIYVPLERAFALHQQKIFRKAWITDSIYFFIGSLVSKLGLAIASIFLAYILHGLVNRELQNQIAAQPTWCQFIEAVFISEVGYYTAHRLTHEIPFLWKFHSIHHSIEHMDWLAAVRVHPLDQIFTKLFQIIPLYLLGFTKETFGIYLLFSAFEAFFIHANVKFKFGWLKWIIATPQFHHWHHSTDPKAYNKNYAAQLPVLDLLFKTFYVPARKMPEQYGILEQIPSNYFRQLLYPFRQQK